MANTAKMAILLGLASLVGLTACAPSRLTEPTLPQLMVTDPPTIRTDANGIQSVDIDVMIYNIAALPWPIRKNRRKATRMIGNELAKMRAAGTAPDIVMIQEGFRASIRDLIERAGYPNWVRGPKAADRMPFFSERAPAEFTRKSYYFRGERIGKLMDGGLYILSNWPITDRWVRPFFRYECAGFDCAANKGVLVASIDVPGMPVPVHVLTTHLNARNSTGVPEQRSLTAHNLQIDHLDDMIDETYSAEAPLLIGGDFNIKEARKRLDYLLDGQPNRPEPIIMVHQACLQRDSACSSMPTPPDVPRLLGSNDWHAFMAGKQVSISIKRLEALFDQPFPDAPMLKGRRTLSDHDALLVRYEISWNPGEIKAQAGYEAATGWPK